MSNIKAKIQLLDKYVKEYKMNLKGKIDAKSETEVDCSLGFGIVNIQEEEKNKIGQIQMIYDIQLLKEKEEIGTIYLDIQALFEAETGMSKKEFEEMLKYNGAATLSQIARAYIISNTSLSGMPTINLPMINFIEFFKNVEAEEKKLKMSQTCNKNVTKM